MEKFKIPANTSPERAIEMLVFEINRLRDLLDSKPLTVKCTCGSDYTGLSHSKYCSIRMLGRAG